MAIELVKTVVLKTTIIGPEGAVDKIIQEPLPLVPGRYEVKTPEGQKVIVRTEKQLGEITKG